MTHAFDFSDGSAGVEWQRSYWLNEQRIADSFGSELPDRLQDLLTLAMAVYVADRRAQRPLATLGLWRRQLAIRVPMRGPSFWSGDDVQESLSSYLGWLTEDDWEFEFVGLPSDRRSSQGQIFSTPPTPPVKVALFSGGLDSLAGAAIDLSSRPVGELILVAASSNDALRRVQFDLVRGLRALGDLRHVNVPLKLVQRVAGTKDERTQRSRGFVYAALGAVVADLAKEHALYTYENGIGSLNLPYAESQIGAQSSRSVHPKTLRKASQLLSLVLDRTFDFRAPNFEITKGELCARMPRDIHAMVRTSVSCDGFPSRIAGRRPCGACTSCLLRRQALHASRLSGLEPTSNYRADERGSSAGVLAERNLHAMLGQASDILSLAVRAEAWASLTNRFPALAAVDECEEQPLLREAARREIVDLLRRYAAEWHSYPSSITHLYFENVHTRRAASG